MGNTVAEKRDSNIELLRIIAIFLVTISHFSLFSNFSVPSASSSPIEIVNHIISQYFALGSLGVNIFVLISGYFLINSTFKLSRIIKIMVCTLIYSLAIYFSFLISGNISFNAMEMVKAFFPVTYETWWFITAYVLMYILSPLINKLLKTIDVKIYRLYLIILALIWSLLQTIFQMPFGCNDLLWLIFMYSIGAYIKIYGINIKKPLLWFFICLLVYFVSATVMDLVSIYTGSTSYPAYLGIKCGVSFPAAIFLFLHFKDRVHIGYNPLINTFASTTLAVYVLQSHPLSTPYIFTQLFPSINYIDKWFFVLYAIAVSITVFICCALIDFIRQFIFEKPFKNVYKKLDGFIQNKWNNYLTK